MRIKSKLGKLVSMFMRKARLLAPAAARLKRLLKGLLKPVSLISLNMPAAKIFLAALAAAVILAGPAAAEKEADSLTSTRKFERQIEEYETSRKNAKKDKSEWEEKYKRKCEKSKNVIQSTCRRLEKQIAAAQRKIDRAERGIQTAKRNMEIYAEYGQKMEAHQEAARKKAAKQAKILKLSAGLTVAAGAALVAQCFSCSPSPCWHWCGLGAMAFGQAAETAGKKNELDDFCRAMGNSNCGPPELETDSDSDPNPACESPISTPALRQAAGCSGEPAPQPKPLPTPKSTPSPKDNKPKVEKKDLEPFNQGSCSLDPKCFTVGPGGDLVMNDEIVPDELKDTSLVGGPRKITSDDIMKRLSPKQKAKFAKAMAGVKAKHAGAVAEMQALTSADSEDGGDDEEDDSEGAGGAGSGKVAGESFQGGASGGGGASGAAAGAGSRRGSRGGGSEEDSIDKQVQALLAKARGRRFGKKGKKRQGLCRQRADSWRRPGWIH